MKFFGPIPIHLGVFSIHWVINDSDLKGSKVVGLRCLNKLTNAISTLIIQSQVKFQDNPRPEYLKHTKVILQEFKTILTYIHF